MISESCAWIVSEKSNNSYRSVTNRHCRVTDLEYISVIIIHANHAPKMQTVGPTQKHKNKNKNTLREHTQSQPSEFAQIIIVNATTVIPTPTFFAFIFAKFGVCFRLLHRSCHGGARVTLKSRTVVRIYFHRARAQFKEQQISFTYRVDPSPFCAVVVVGCGLLF